MPNKDKKQSGKKILFLCKECNEILFACKLSWDEIIELGYKVFHCKLCRKALYL